MPKNPETKSTVGDLISCKTPQSPINLFSMKYTRIGNLTKFMIPQGKFGISLTIVEEPSKLRSINYMALITLLKQKNNYQNKTHKTV